MIDPDKLAAWRQKFTNDQPHQTEGEAFRSAANLVQRDGFLYGLDDGIFACVDLADGSQRWKEGRYGHGQGLLVRDLFLGGSERHLAEEALRICDGPPG